GKYTKNKGPWVLVYSESYITRSEAVKREKYFKTGVGRDLIKKITGL
ncbi:MAG: GIY-YIG nuclease family protein, partial [Bacteroidota bacterium]